MKKKGNFVKTEPLLKDMDKIYKILKLYKEKEMDCMTKKYYNAAMSCLQDIIKDESKPL